MDPGTSSSKIVVDVLALEKIEKLVEHTASGGPEHCGNMKVRYNPYLGYIASDFVKDQEKEDKLTCIPRIGSGQGIWHTHPLGLCEASETDLDTMKEDAMVALRGTSPGVAPVNLVITLDEKGKLCIKGYLPGWDVEYKIVGHYPYVIESVAPVLSGNIAKHPSYDYYGMIVEKKEDDIDGQLCRKANGCRCRLRQRLGYQLPLRRATKS